MNKTILMGRLTKDPEVKYFQNENSTAMARYTLAVDRRCKWNYLYERTLLLHVHDIMQSISSNIWNSLDEKYIHTLHLFPSTMTVLKDIP